MIILWDFDGVLMNSNAVRDKGFEHVLATYPEEQVEQLLRFHRDNGGLSRYVKFRHFFEIIREEELPDDRLAQLCAEFSDVMRNLLVNPDLLIDETIRFAEAHQHEYPMYIVSGSDEKELRYLCEQHGIARWFNGIFGSPTPKKELVRRVIVSNTYNPSDCLLVGDSINDYEAAKENGISFQAYNNASLEKYNSGLSISIC